MIFDGRFQEKRDRPVFTRSGRAGLRPSDWRHERTRAACAEQRVLARPVAEAQALGFAWVRRFASGRDPDEDDVPSAVALAVLSLADAELLLAEALDSGDGEAVASATAAVESARRQRIASLTSGAPCQIEAAQFASTILGKMNQTGVMCFE